MQSLRGARPQDLPRDHRRPLTGEETEAYRARGPWAAATLVPPGSHLALWDHPLPGSAISVPLCGEQLRQTSVPALRPTALLPSRRRRMPGARRVRENVAHRFCNPARFSKLFSSPPRRGRQQPMGAEHLPATANHKAEGCSGQDGPRPRPRPSRTLEEGGGAGEPPRSVGGATCIRWDWLTLRREGRRLASEDGPIPRGCGLAGASQCLWGVDLPVGLDQSWCAVASGL